MDEKVLYVVLLLLLALGVFVAVYVATSKTLFFEADHLFVLATKDGVVVESVETQVFNYNVVRNASGMTMFVGGIVVALVAIFVITERSSKRMIVLPALIVYTAVVAVVTMTVTIFTGTFKAQKITCVSDVRECAGDSCPVDVVVPETPVSTLMTTVALVGGSIILAVLLGAFVKYWLRSNSPIADGYQPLVEATEDTEEDLKRLSQRTASSLDQI